MCGRGSKWKELLRAPVFLFYVVRWARSVLGVRAVLVAVVRVLPRCQQVVVVLVLVVVLRPVCVVWRFLMLVLVVVARVVLGGCGVVLSEVLVGVVLVVVA